jgi:hypothetical protein
MCVQLEIRCCGFWTHWGWTSIDSVAFNFIEGLLVGFGTFFIFPYIGKNNPNWRIHIFQRGRSTTNQIIIEQPFWDILSKIRMRNPRLANSVKSCLGYNKWPGRATASLEAWKQMQKLMESWWAEIPYVKWWATLRSCNIQLWKMVHFFIVCLQKGGREWMMLQWCFYQLGWSVLLPHARRQGQGCCKGNCSWLIYGFYRFYSI